MSQIPWKKKNICSLIFFFLSLNVVIPYTNVFPLCLSQDTYPKGVIPLGAIQMARATKDNKFEIVTNHRTFVFRADNEGKHINRAFISFL